MCSREKDVLDLELEQCRKALEKRGMKQLRSQTEYFNVSEWNVILGSGKMQSAHLLQVTEFKYLEITQQSDSDMSTEVNK